MDQEFILKMKEKLLNMKKEILKDIEHERQEHSAYDEIGDVADLATVEMEREAKSQLLGGDIKLLTNIENALIRVENGTYGICLKSGKEIPKARLEALPYALYTIEVQNQLDEM